MGSDHFLVLIIAPTASACRLAWPNNYSNVMFYAHQSTQDINPCSVASMEGHCLECWPNIDDTLDECPVLADMSAINLLQSSPWTEKMSSKFVSRWIRLESSCHPMNKGRVHCTPYNHRLPIAYTEHCAACSDQTQTACVYPNADSSPSKHEDSTQSCFNVGQAPLAVGQYWNSIGSNARVCWTPHRCLSTPTPPPP